MATGVPFDIPEVHRWTIQDGKAVKAHFAIDTLAMLEVLANPTPRDPSPFWHRILGLGPADPVPERDGWVEPVHWATESGELGLNCTVEPGSEGQAPVVAFGLSGSSEEGRHRARP